MKNLFALCLLILSSALYAEGPTHRIQCGADDHATLDILEVGQSYEIHFHKAGGLDLARALKLKDVGRYWRYSSAAFNLPKCDFMSEGQFNCTGEAIPFAMGWPSYTDQFAEVSISGSKAENGLAISLRVRDASRIIDVTDQFYFQSNECKSSN